MKKLLAILLALSMLVAFAACGAKDNEETTEPTEEITEEISEDVSEEASEPESEEPSSEEASEPASETEAETSSEAASEDASESESETEAPKAPQTKAEIVEYFNNSINEVKPKAKKITRNYEKITINGSLTLPSSLNTILKILGGADSFVGGQLEKNSKLEPEVLSDKNKFPVEDETWSSKLTPADVKSATLTESNGKYVITITTVDDAKSDSVKHGQGHAPKALNAVLPGIVNDNIPSVATSMVGTAKMGYPSSSIKVVIDPATGHVEKADYSLNWTIYFDKAGAILPFTTASSYTIDW